jgi:dienelactone hydrolase
MGQGVIKAPDSLEDFTRRSVTLNNLERAVFVSGDGPGVIIMHEVPGITPEVARFARWVRDAGFRVYLPSLLGQPGKPNSRGYALSSVARACIAREFSLLAGDKSSLIVDWLRALARLAHGECGGPGVGALGMCLTGNFALSMLLEPAVRAPVMCQPSLPVVALGGKPDGLHAAPGDVAAVRERLEREDLTIEAYRFAGDPLCPGARFDAFAAALGPRFSPHVLADEDGRQGTLIPKPHSVVTTHLIDTDGAPTRRAVEEIIAFFRLRLKPAA